MTSPAPGPVPPGWYPDPGGERQWRVWTGRDWSSVTRPYDAATAPVTVADSLRLVTAMHRLHRFGVVAVFAGLGLAESVRAHWPGTAHPIGATLAATLLSTALALLTIGYVMYAIAGRALVGRWTPWVFVPWVNIIGVSTFVSSHLGETGALRRLGVDLALLVLFLYGNSAHPYLAVIPALVTLDLTTSLQRLNHQLVGLVPGPVGAS